MMHFWLTIVVGLFVVGGCSKLGARTSGEEAPLHLLSDSDKCKVFADRFFNSTQYLVGLPGEDTFEIELSWSGPSSKQEKKLTCYFRRRV